MNIQENIAALGLVLPPAGKPVGAYQPVVITGNMAFLSGQISKTAEGKLLAGKVGTDLTLEAGQRAAHAAALNALSVMQHFVGFEKIERITRVVGYVQSAPDFFEIPKVVDAASNLFLKIFENNGVHARSAVGVASLPLNAAVELEATLQIR